MKLPTLSTTLIAAFAFVLAGLNFSGTAQVQVIAADSIIILTPRGMSQEETQKLDGEYPVDGNGNISGLHLLPNDGTFRAAGKTPEQLAREIEQAYIQNQFYTRIRVTIQVKAVDETGLTKTLTMGGEVNRAGTIPWREGLTVIEAIAQAQGRTQFGGKTVGILRNGQETLIKLDTPEGKAFVLQADDYVEVWEQGMFRDIRPSR